MRYVLPLLLITLLTTATGVKVVPDDEVRVECFTKYGTALSVVLIAQFNYTWNVLGIEYRILNVSYNDEPLQNYTVEYKSRQFEVGKNTLYNGNVTIDNRTYYTPLRQEVRLNFTEIAVAAYFTIFTSTSGIGDWDGCFSWRFVRSGENPPFPVSDEIDWRIKYIVGTVVFFTILIMYFRWNSRRRRE